MKGDTRQGRQEKLAKKLEERILDAVKFVPVDQGDDESKTVEVNLADLRELVGCAWAGQRGFESTARKLSRKDKVIGELLELVESLEE